MTMPPLPNGNACHSSLRLSQPPIIRVDCPIAGVGVAYTERGLTAAAIPGAKDKANQTARTGFSQPPFDAFNLGLHVGDDPLAVKANRLALKQALDVEPFWLNQVHGTQVAPVRHQGSLSRPETLLEQDTHGLGVQADASLSNMAGQACAILTADCLPVLIATASGRVVGAAHAGWRGLAQGVIAAVIEAMFSAHPTDCRTGLWAWLGPCIGFDQFEVGGEVVEALKASQARSAQFRPSPAGRWLADLQAIATEQIRQVTKAHQIPLVDIAHQSSCTFSNPSAFYSYRREAKTGRMAALIWPKADV